MENLFLPDLSGPFDLEDFILDDPLIDDTVFPVQNFDAPEPNITAQEVLEETILSPPADNWFGTSEELDNFFPEKFIDLAGMESNMNSFNTDPSFLADDNTMAQVFQEILVPMKEEQTPTENIFLANAEVDIPAEDSIVSNVIPDVDSLAVVPDVIPESPPLTPFGDTTDSGIFGNNLSLDLDKLNPAILELLENLEKSNQVVEAVAPSHNRKRPLPVEEVSNNLLNKKKKLLPASSTTEEPKIVERRMKNNAASRVCRATRKARHQGLFEKEKELAKENEELTSKVEELSATVEYLRGYLVEKLSGRHN